MSNMPHCRFRNTLEDMHNCDEHMEGNDLSEEEAKARRAMIRLCADIAESYGHEVGLTVDVEHDE